MEETRILVIEDEADVRKGLRKLFEAEGYLVTEAEDGDIGLELAQGETDGPDLIVLDLMVPKRDGFDVCRSLRARGRTTPVLILSARSSDVDKVVGLELGADDYVTKPFSVQELIARVRALLRRVEIQRNVGEISRFGEVVIDFKRRCGARRGEAFELYHFEVQILKVLMEGEGEVVARSDLLNRIWGYDAFPSTRTVDFHVCNLRKKIEANPRKPKHLLTVHGLGYRFVR